MASFQSEIELRVKVIDKELNELEKRVQKIQNPFSASGASKGASKAELRQRQVLLNVDKNRLELQQRFKADQIKQLSITSSWLKVLRQGEEVRKDIARAAEREAKATQKAAASAQKAAKAKGKRGLQSAALGVGFPLLFGGGAGSVAGGLLGSGFGFGGQILGSALGQAVDNFVTKGAELGQALNALTPDIDALVKAAGLAGTETERLIKGIEKLEGAQKAQELAAAQLATVVGQDGVAALEDAGAAAQEFTNEAAKAFTALSVALAPALTAVAKFLANNIEESRLLSRTDPGFLGVGAGDLANNKEVTQIRDYLNKGIITETTARERLLEIVREIEAADQRIADNKANELVKDSASIQIAESKADLLLMQGDLTDRAVYLKRIEIAGLEYEQKIRKGNLSVLEKQVAEQEYLNELQGIKNDRDRALERSARTSARSAEAAARKARQNQAALLAEQNKLYAVDIKITQATEGRAAAIIQELENLQAAYTIDAQRIILSTEDRALAQAKVDTLAKEYELKQILLRQEYASIQQQKEILKLKQQQALAGISTDIGRQIEDANFRSTGNAAQDEQLQLRIDQTRRAEDATTRLTNAIAEQQQIINNPANADQAMKAEDERKRLQDRLNLYNQLLPQLDAAEQAQLRYNQVLEAAQPYAAAFANSLTQGLRDVVNGTKTAEEAFADFLNNIADLLIQTATQMIAQYIAIGIARTFAGVPGGTVGDGGTGALARTKTNFFGNALEVFGRGYVPGRTFDGGGYTGDGPRSGGADGKGGFLALLHPQETVVDHYGAASDAMGASTAAAASASGASPAMLAAGGSEASASGTTSTIAFETYSIGGMDVVTRDEAIRIGQESAKQAKAQVFSDMRNKPSTRRQLGLN